MSFWAIENLKSVLGGKWLARGDQPRTEGVSTDSRAIKPGQVFIALRGERTDGHQYLRQVVDAGAALLVVSDAGKVPAAFERPVGVLQVADTGAALLRLGAAYRQTLSTTRVIAVGGSNGKTTTVRLVHAALAAKFQGTHSPKSFNNAVGVPLTMLGAKRSDRYLICEVGTNAPGEIAPLARAVEPDIAVITSIGREHLEGLGSIAGIVQEEVSLLAGLRADGVAILNADAPGLVDAARPIVAAQRATILTFGFDPGADLRITEVAVSAAGTRFQLNGRDWLTVPMPGRHNASNAAAAVAVARRMGVDPAAIGAALAAAQGPPMRLERASHGGVDFVNDAYNANPDSVLASIRTFGDLVGEDRSRRRVIVLGDMLELGSQAPAMHREVGEAVGGCPWVDLAVFIGPLSFSAAEAARAGLGPSRVTHMPDVSGAPAATAMALRRGDVVLLKGSRGTGVERVLDAWKVACASPDLLEPKPMSVGEG